jgi:hypothetical protein
MHKVSFVIKLSFKIACTWQYSNLGKMQASPKKGEKLELEYLRLEVGLMEVATYRLRTYIKKNRLDYCWY